ncbi:MAG: ABC transporter permease [Chloroflexi bacterium]|nr:ABC transporter permease [Chloroflexota bacterium]
MRQTLRFTGSLLRAYVRDRSALFFTFFMPFLFMLIFGSLNFGALGRIEVGYVDEAGGPDAERIVGALQQVSALRLVRVDDRAALDRRLQRSELDMGLVLPAGFLIAPGSPATLELYADQAAPQESGVGRSIVMEVVGRASLAASGSPPAIIVSERRVSGVRLRYVDFLVPGILGLNVMQLNIFSVAFALVIQRQRGVIRRIFATPLSPTRFLAAHSLLRLALSAAQVGILLALAFLLFEVRVVGSLADLLVVAIAGAVAFLMQGFAIAGWARTENQVPPVANLITLPQFFLSGVLFPKETAPDVIEPITGYLPLTLFNDALREISAQGASLWDVRAQLLGLVLWGLAGFVVAVRLLKLREE